MANDKINCWQFMNCGREPGGIMVDLLGECPVATALKYDGLNDGRGAGRSCWMVCSSGDPASYRIGCGRSRCHTCDFYRRVVFEQEGQTRFKFSAPESQSA